MSRSIHFTAASKAALTAAASSILFACMAMIARLLSPAIPGQQVAFVRFLTGVVVTALALFARWEENHA